MSTADRLDERYGRRAPTPGRRRLVLAGVAAAAVLAIAWTVWAGVGLAGQQDVSVQVVGFSEPTDTEVVLTFSVAKDPDASVSCDVRALSQDYATIGYTTVEIPPSDASVVREQVTIRTQQRAVSADVLGCEAV